MSNSEINDLIDALVSGDDTALQIKKAINQAFIEDHIAGLKSNPRDGLHASSLKTGFTGKWRHCFKEHVLNKYHYPNYQKTQHVIDIETARRWKVGWYLHLMFQRLFKRAGYALEIEQTRTDTRYGVYYTIDIISRFPKISGDRRYVTEIKTMNSDTYEKAINQSDIRKVHVDGYKQIQIYMYLTKVDTTIKYVDRGILLIFNKDTNDFSVYIIEPDEKFLKPYKDRLDMQLSFYLAHERTGKYPPRVCNSENDARAKSCAMGYICWLDQDEREKYKRKKMLGSKQINVSLIHKDDDDV